MFGLMLNWIYTVQNFYCLMTYVILLNFKIDKNTQIFESHLI